LGMHKGFEVLILLALGGWVGLLAGCGRQTGGTKVASPAEVNLQKILRLYGEFQRSQHKAPANADELKAWAKKQSKEKLTEMSIEDVDTVFISPRDNEPYEVVQLPMGRGPLVAHEKTGVGGKRYVIGSTGTLVEMDQKQFEEQRQNVPGRR
jgi:hypothetical protein